MREMTRIIARVAILLLWTAPSALAARQDAELRGRGTVKDADGSYRLPTPEEALRALTMEIGEDERILGNYQNRRDPIVAMLRQEFEPRSRVELDALADALVEMALATDDPIGDEASWALISSRWPRDGGVPYAGAFEALVRIYETRVERLVGDAEDPFKEIMIGSLDGTLPWNQVRLASGALYSLQGVEGGRDYLRELFEKSEPPPACQSALADLVIEMPGCPPPPGATWCQTGYLLFNWDWNLYEDGPNPAAPEGFYDRCDGAYPGKTIFLHLLPREMRDTVPPQILFPEAASLGNG